MDDEDYETCEIARAVSFDDGIGACGSDTLKILAIAKLVGLREDDVADMEHDYEKILRKFDDPKQRKKMGYREIRKVVVAQTWKNIQDGVTASDAFDAAWEYVEEAMLEVDKDF